MGTLFDLLEKVCDRPEMYSPDGSLGPIETMCHGYAAALGNHGVHEFGSDFNQRFARYLEARHGYSTARGWARAIELDLRSDETALERLRTLVHWYKDSHA